MVKNTLATLLLLALLIPIVTLLWSFLPNRQRSHFSRWLKSAAADILSDIFGLTARSPS